MVNFYFLLKLCLFVTVTIIPRVSSATLTKDNFLETTKGKSVFIKWFAPWCGHCQELAPKWKQMAQELENNENVLVASVDCTQEEAWCVSLGIQGFPTLLFGDPSHGGVFLEAYNGDKTYEALSEFANETLNKPICSPGDLTVCDGSAKKKIHEVWGLSDSDLEKDISQQERLIETAENEFRQKFDAMQATYDKEEFDHESQLAKMLSNVRLMKKLLN